MLNLTHQFCGRVKFYDELSLGVHLALRNDAHNGRWHTPIRLTAHSFWDTTMKIIAAVFIFSGLAAFGGYQMLDRKDCDGKQDPRHGDRPSDDHRPRDAARPRADHGAQRPEMESDGDDRRSDALENAVDGDVVLQGGFETDRRDGGRPVKLIAAALGVEDQVFREAFKKVQPSRSGPPSPWRARQNKEVLMNALGPHGITNDRLDEVSNRYRYRPQDGELWTHKLASATAVIKDGKVIEIKIDESGFGYSSPPSVSMKGFPDVKLKASIEFSADMDKNGRLTSIEIIE